MIKVTVIALQPEAAENSASDTSSNVSNGVDSFRLKTEGQFEIWAIFTDSHVRLDWPVIERQLSTDGACTGEVNAGHQEHAVITAIQVAQSKRKEDVH